jgi:serine/threonine-protein kinase
MTPASSAPGENIGRYRLKEKLPAGEFGISYRAWDSVLRRDVMMKLMLAPSGMGEDEWEQLKWRFLQEAKAAGRLNHPGIISVYEAGEHENFVFSVMEYRRERSLADHTVQGSLLPVKQVLGIGEQIAKALDYAHRHLVVHRDIRPANIIHTPATGAVTVSNFGLARLLDKTRTRTGAVLGNPSSYMSPEQISGKKVDHRTDIYSLGVTLYQLLTGTLPFEDKTLANLMGQIAYHPAPAVRERRAELDLTIQELLSTALQKQVDRRFQTARLMAKAISACETN